MKYLSKYLSGSTGSASNSSSSETSKETASRQIRCIARIAIRLVQFIMGIVVIGLYAPDLVAARTAGKYTDSRWLFAVIVGTISAIAAGVLPFVRSWFFFAIDTIIWFFFLVLFGMFGKMYIREDPEGNAGIARMKAAVWVDLTCLALWFITAVYGGVMFWKSLKASGQKSDVEGGDAPYQPPTQSSMHGPPVSYSRS